MNQQIIKKLLITGANGFIGGSLMRYYQNQGQDVVGVDLVGNGGDIVDISHMKITADIINADGTATDVKTIGSVDTI